MQNKLQQFFFTIIFLISTALVANTEVVDISFLGPSELNRKNDLALAFKQDSTVAFEPKHRKLKAVLLAVFLGHFGVHRIYLGTKENVPVMYSLTLGGGFGLLPLLDIVAILTTKDLERFEQSNRVFMWTKPPKKRNN